MRYYSLCILFFIPFFCFFNVHSSFAKDKTFILSSKRVKTFLIESGLNPDDEWNNFIDELPLSEEKQLLDSSEKRKDLFSEKLKEKINLFHAQIRNKIQNALSESSLSPSYTKNQRDSLEKNISSYYSLNSFIRRALMGDEYILDAPSLPLKLKFQGLKKRIYSFSYLSQSQKTFKSLEGEEDAFDAAPDSSLNSSYFRSIMNYLTYFLFFEQAIQNCLPKPFVPSPEFKEKFPCYQVDPYESSDQMKEFLQCKNYLQIYTCEGHSFSKLHLAGEDYYRGLYPQEDAITLNNVFGWVHNELGLYSLDRINKCQSTTYPLTQKQGEHIKYFYEEVSTDFAIGKEKFNLLRGANCADFSQRVFTETGYPGHFLDRQNKDKPMNIFSYPEAAFAKIDKSALWAYYRQGGVLKVAAQMIYELALGLWGSHPDTNTQKINPFE